MEEANDQSSIPVRVRKVTVEDAYIRVPIMPEMLEPDGDGTYSINSEVFTQWAMRVANDPKVQWKFEELSVELHENQQAAPNSRIVFRPE